MSRRQYIPRSRGVDLAALVVVLGSAVALVALGVSAEAVGTVALALSGLYSTWLGGRDNRAALEVEGAKEKEPQL